MTIAFDLAGKTALVTGASQGLGQRFAKVLAGAGAKVGLAARQIDKLAALEAEIRDGGGHASSVTLDVTAPESIALALDTLVSTLGPIDILINNAGIAVTKPLLEQTEQDWDSVLDTNLKGAFLTAQAVGRRMVEQGGGCIVNIASVLAVGVIGQLGPYAASKAALWQLTRTMALELARHQVRVNALAPGYIETDINRDFLESPAGQRLLQRIPQRRFGQAEDLDGALLLLASDAGRYITGSLLVVDGGMLLT